MVIVQPSTRKAFQLQLMITCLWIYGMELGGGNYVKPFCLSAYIVSTCLPSASAAFLATPVQAGKMSFSLALFLLFQWRHNHSVVYEVYVCTLLPKLCSESLQNLRFFWRGYCYHQLLLERRNFIFLLITSSYTCRATISFLCDCFSW